MPHAEYVEWQEFYTVEPFGLAVQDALHAQHISMMANVNRNSEVREEPFTTADFLLFAEPTTQPEEETEPTVDGLTADEWKMLMFFQSLQRRQDYVAALEQAPEASG